MAEALIQLVVEVEDRLILAMVAAALIQLAVEEGEVQILAMVAVALTQIMVEEAQIQQIVEELIVGFKSLKYLHILIRK